MIVVFFELVAASKLEAYDNQKEVEEVKKRMTTKVLWGRDPFSDAGDDSFQPSFDRSPAKGLSLTGILIRGASKTAIINHTLIQEGEEIQGFTILKIESDKVLLQDKTNEVMLRLGEV